MHVHVCIYLKSQRGTLVDCTFFTHLVQSTNVYVEYKFKTLYAVQIFPLNCGIYWYATLGFVCLCTSGTHSICWIAPRNMLNFADLYI